MNVFVMKKNNLNMVLSIMMLFLYFISLQYSSELVFLVLFSFLIVFFISIARPGVTLQERQALFIVVYLFYLAFYFYMQNVFVTDASLDIKKKTSLILKLLVFYVSALYIGDCP